MVGILGLKNKGGVKICWIQGDLLVCGGLHFPGGFGFQRRKSPLLAFVRTNFQNFSPAARAGHFTLLKKSIFKKVTCSSLSPFSEYNMVNTMK